MPPDQVAVAVVVAEMISNMTPKLVAIMFIINTNNEVLLYRRINTWYEPNKLALIGGNVDTGESPITAAIREVREETGLVVNSAELLCVQKKKDYEINYFLSRDWTGVPDNKEPERCGGLSWHNLNDLPEDTIEDIKELVKTHVTFR